MWERGRNLEHKLISYIKNCNDQLLLEANGEKQKKKRSKLTFILLATTIDCEFELARLVFPLLCQLYHEIFGHIYRNFVCFFHFHSSPIDTSTEYASGCTAWRRYNTCVQCWSITQGNQLLATRKWWVFTKYFFLSRGIRHFRSIAWKLTFRQVILIN